MKLIVRFRILYKREIKEIKRSLCENCTKYVYSIINRSDFCKLHGTPVFYYMQCAYFKSKHFYKL